MNQLDNPVWFALQTVHRKFALGTQGFQRYPNDVLRIGGCEDPATADLNEIAPWLPVGEKMFIVGELPRLTSGWNTYTRLECIQMICPLTPKIITDGNLSIERLSEGDHADMHALINLVQPGYFHAKTPLLGNYYGIRSAGKLVAMAGERLKITGFTEISAVGTHPDHTGRGYAQQLIAHLVHENLKSGNLPFLHFVPTNTRALRVYELLGFQLRKEISFWGVERE